MEYSIDEFKEVMTIFYNKRLGVINSIFSGGQDFSVYGEEEEDFKMILDKIILKYDEFVISNPSKFIIKNDEIVLKEVPYYLNKYNLG